MYHSHSRKCQQTLELQAPTPNSSSRDHHQTKIIIIILLLNNSCSSQPLMLSTAFTSTKLCKSGLHRPLVSSTQPDRAVPIVLVSISRLKAATLVFITWSQVDSSKILDRLCTRIQLLILLSMLEVSSHLSAPVRTVSRHPCNAMTNKIKITILAGKIYNQEKESMIIRRENSLQW